MKEAVERRKHKRFRAPPGAYAIHGPFFTTRTQIVDISRDGLAFRYIGRADTHTGPQELDILFAEGSFYLPKVPVNTISDGIAKDKPFDSIPMRRRGMQFGELAQDQLSQLEYFIENHTLGEVEAESERSSDRQ